jgi:hypothetical protein
MGIPKKDLDHFNEWKKTKNLKEWMELRPLPATGDSNHMEANKNTNDLDSKPSATSPVKKKLSRQMPDLLMHSTSVVASLAEVEDAFAIADDIMDIELEPDAQPTSKMKAAKALQGESSPDSDSRTLADLAKPDSAKPDGTELEDLNELSQFNDFSAFQGRNNLRLLTSTLML